uniref:Cytochrome P450 n=1 Tax=Chrysemys picta bellii TaxID=8478 RepID=A0A8C3IXH5_CHRPI
MDAGLAGILSLFLILSIMCFMLWKNNWKRDQLPPGPAPWFLLGNLWQKDVLPLQKSYQKLYKKYGPVFTVWLGPKPAVVLCGYEAVRDALVGHAEEFGGRAAIAIHERVTDGYGGEKKWRELRRFTITTLRNFGMGKKTMAQRVQEETQYLVEAVADMEGEAFDPISSVRHAVSNVVCAVVFGSRFSYKDQAFLELLGMMGNYSNYFMSPFAQVYNTFPGIMRYLPGPHNKVFNESEKLKNFIQKRIDSHKRTLEPSCPRDYIDCFLIKSEKGKSTSEDVFSDENLLMAVFDLFGAGTVSTANSLLFFFLVMAKFPQIQARVQQEIEEVVGATHAPSMEDRVRMPYTNAVIHEMQRSQKGQIENFPRAVTRRTEFRGYIIPQGTAVIPLFSTVHSDPKHWKTPEEFNPGHFLDEKGEFRPNEAFMPFSAGKRMCPGEGLARMELFLFFSTLLQNFTFKLATDPKEMDILSLWVDYQNKGPYCKFHLIRR